MNWTFRNQYKTGTTNAAKIIDFYVVECPAKGSTNRGQSFADFGWIGARFNTLQASMRRCSSLASRRWKCVNIDEVEKTLEGLDEYKALNPKDEFAVYCKSRKYGKTESLFYLVRCALAHGSFDIRTVKGTKYYILENRHDGVLRGRAVLKEKTLLKWIELVKET